MKKILVATLILTSGGVALADTINFAQIGPDGTTATASTTTPLTGVTAGGVDWSLVSPNGGVTMYQEGLDWDGDFVAGTPLMFDNWGGGPLTIDFTTAIASLTLAAQANAVGTFTETMLAYNGTTLVDVVTGTDYNPGQPNTTGEGTIPYLTVTNTLNAGAGITSVLVETTNDSEGIGLADPVPEPSTYALLLTGLGLVYVAARRRGQSLRVTAANPA